jgi:hypothetical protein
MGRRKDRRFPCTRNLGHSRRDPNETQRPSNPFTMAKKTKTSKSAARPARKKPQPAKKRQSPKKQGAPKKLGAAGKGEAPKKRGSSVLGLTLPLARARKLAGDLYEAAGLALWAEAIETADETKRSALIHLQDSVCEAADFLREAKATNPKRLHLFCVACLGHDGLPTTKPRFVTAASEKDALAIWRKAFKGEFGRRRPRAHLVPALAAAPGLHE